MSGISDSLTCRHLPSLAVTCRHLIDLISQFNAAPTWGFLLRFLAVGV